MSTHGDPSEKDFYSTMARGELPKPIGNLTEAEKDAFMEALDETVQTEFLNMQDLTAVEEEIEVTVVDLLGVYMGTKDLEEVATAAINAYHRSLLKRYSSSVEITPEDIDAALPFYGSEQDFINGVRSLMAPLLATLRATEQAMLVAAENSDRAMTEVEALKVENERLRAQMRCDTCTGLGDSPGCTTPGCANSSKRMVDFVREMRGESDE